MKKKAHKTAPKAAARKITRPSKKAAKRKRAASSPTARRVPAAAGKAAGHARIAAAAAGRRTIPDSHKKLFRDLLLTMRERITGQIQALKIDSLQRHDEVNSAEDGTDAFDRQFALNLVSSENDAVFEIDEALLRLDEGQYGVCEDCSGLVEGPRLKALPFVRKCVSCQSKSEAGKLKFRPLSPAEEV